MSEQLKESLSAVMDGEADAFELRRVLDEAKVNDEMREQWRSYHLLRDHMRGEATLVRPELRDAIWAELSAIEPEQDAELALVTAESDASAASDGKSKASWVGRITGMAVAASVAAMVVISGGVFDDAQGPGSIAKAPSLDNVVIEDSGAAIPGVDNLVPQFRAVADDQDVRRHKAYLLYHTQRNAMHNQSMAGFSKILTLPGDAVRPLSQEEVSKDEVVEEGAQTAEATDSQ